MIRKVPNVMRGALDDPIPAPSRSRRPYQRPEITFREPLERFASICSPPGKASVTSCPQGPISS